MNISRIQETTTKFTIVIQCDTLSFKISLNFIFLSKDFPIVTYRFIHHLIILSLLALSKLKSERCQ